MQPLFPYEVGIMRNGGYVNGLQVFTQPGGPGTPVSPQPPRTNPPSNWKNQGGIPVYPTAFVGLLSWGCGHWTNTAEIVTVDNPYDDCRAALVCCPCCSYIQEIIEPASDWWVEWYSLFPVGVKQNAFSQVEA
jgi:hypothetical protein